MSVARLVATCAALLVACTAPERAPTAVARPVPAIYTAPGTVMKYSASLPAGWTRDRTWPVVVVIPDATRDFDGNLAAFAAAGATSPFVFVAPHVVTSGGARGYRDAPGFHYSAGDWAEVDRLGDFRFDEEGVASVIADVHVRFQGDERVYLTGWEAGGHTVWALLFRHPERFRAVAPVTPNYVGRWLDAEHPVSQSGSPPSVKVFFCGTGCAPDDVRQNLRAQTQQALALARDHGFGEIPIEVREGTKHGPLATFVVDWFTALAAARR